MSENNREPAMENSGAPAPAEEAGQAETGGGASVKQAETDRATGLKAAETGASDHPSPTGPGGGKPRAAPEESGNGADIAAAFNLKLPEFLMGNKDLMEFFQKSCESAGLSREQAQSVVDWHMAGMRQQKEKAVLEGRKVLRAVWGAKTEENMAGAMMCFNLVDRAMEGRLSASEAGKVLADSPEFIEALAAVGGSLREDSLSGFNHGWSGGGEFDFTAFYKKIFHIKD